MSYNPGEQSGSVGTEGARMNSLQSDYLDYAGQFYEAYVKLPRRSPPKSWPRYFLLCHSIELALKAYLSATGFTPRQLRARSVRHNLTNLLTEALAKGLSLPQSAQNDIKLLHKAHEDFWHRYPNDAVQFPTIEQFRRTARQLLLNVSTAIQ
jgi:hypothetical protein